LPDRLLNADEVASMLGVPVTWVREHSRNGHLPSVPLGRYVRYDQADVLAWVDAQKRGGAAWGRYRPTVEGVA
jgi:excisionase family DNA binding protein